MITKIKYLLLILPMMVTLSWAQEKIVPSPVPTITTSAAAVLMAAPLPTPIATSIPPVATPVPQAVVAPVAIPPKTEAETQDSASVSNTPTFSEREKELLDFQSIKNILKQDDLEKEAVKKQEKMAKDTQRRVDRLIDRQNIPGNDEIWSFLSELWLVRNATLLKWDFEKADLGLDVYFREVLKVLGIYQVSFKILILNNPSLPHAVLPSRKGELIMVLSLPFIQTMDLTKQEISMLFLENYFRSESGILQKKLSSPEFEKVLGKNFYQNPFPREEMEKTLVRYDNLFFKDGFQFQEQFDVTKKMNVILKSYPNYWNAYLSLLKKINELVKGNMLYQNYTKIYPSPEMQRRWLLPTDH